MDRITVERMKEQARRLAVANRTAESAIERVYWFPSDREVRLVELERDAPRLGASAVRPFYFRAAPEKNLPARMAIALIHPDDYRKAALPKGWGSWDDAQLLESDA